SCCASDVSRGRLRLSRNAKKPGNAPGLLRNRSADLLLLLLSRLLGVRLVVALGLLLRRLGRCNGGGGGLLLGSVDRRIGHEYGVLSKKPKYEIRYSTDVTTNRAITRRAPAYIAHAVPLCLNRDRVLRSIARDEKRAAKRSRAR